MILLRKTFSGKDSRKNPAPRFTMHIDGKDENGKRFIVPYDPDTKEEGERIYFSEKSEKPKEKKKKKFDFFSKEKIAERNKNYFRSRVALGSRNNNFMNDHLGVHNQLQDMHHQAVLDFHHGSM